MPSTRSMPKLQYPLHSFNVLQESRKELLDVDEQYSAGTKQSRCQTRESCSSSELEDSLALKIEVSGYPVGQNKGRVPEPRAASSFTSFHFYQKSSGQFEPVSSPRDGNACGLLSLTSSSTDGTATLHYSRSFFIETTPVELSNLDFPLLEIADIDAYLPHYTKSSEKVLINMFQGLHHVQSLNISFYTIEVLMEFPGIVEAQAFPFGRLKTLNVQCYNNSLKIPDNVMNYFVSGTTFGENISIEIEENQMHES
ncbi:hypothetical protein CRYUN_Cryun13aG0143500 [Craigia yunnanensis]